MLQALWQGGNPGAAPSPLPLAAAHLQSVLNGIREVLQGTDGDGLLRWVLAGAVGLCQEGDHHLDIALGAQGA